MGYIFHTEPRAERPDILVVDDDEDTLGELASLVSAAGYFCHKAADPERAIGKVASNSKIGVVVTDIQMPGRAGCRPWRRQMRSSL